LGGLLSIATGRKVKHARHLSDSLGRLRPQLTYFVEKLDDSPGGFGLIEGTSSIRLGLFVALDRLRFLSFVLLPFKVPRTPD
jgi:hypothetical protein